MRQNFENVPLRRVGFLPTASVGYSERAQDANSANSVMKQSYMPETAFVASALLHVQTGLATDGSAHKTQNPNVTLRRVRQFPSSIDQLSHKKGRFKYNVSTNW